VLQIAKERYAAFLPREACKRGGIVRWSAGIILLVDGEDEARQNASKTSTVTDYIIVFIR
jgi:hypothetical protein